MDIASINSQYIDNIRSTTDATDRLKQLAGRYSSDRTGASRTSAAGEGTQDKDKELMDVCKKFEAYFIEQVLKEVKKTVPDSTLGSSANAGLVDYFMDETIQKVSENIQEKSGLGLAQQMYEQMKRNYSIPEVQPDADTQQETDADAQAVAAAGNAGELKQDAGDDSADASGDRRASAAGMA